MCAFDEAFTDQITHSVLHFDFMCEIDVWWRADFQSMADFQVTRAP